MKTITLTQSKAALVDDEDYEYLSQWKWYANKIGSAYYAVRTIYKPKRQTILMHRVILNAPDRIQVDHINSNELDNRKINLRLCNHGENIRHQQLSCNNTIGFKGISLYKRNLQKPYRVQININNKNIYLGYYHTPEEAAQAYDKAALKYHKEFALTNEMMGLF